MTPVGSGYAGKPQSQSLTVLNEKSSDTLLLVSQLSQVTAVTALLPEGLQNGFRAGH